MTLVNFIENLQRKPYSARFRIFFVAVLISVVIVIVGFSFSIKHSLRDSASSDREADKGEKSGDSMLSLGKMLKSSIGEIFDFKSGVDKNAVNPSEPEKSDLEDTGLRLPR